jgi:hypothetical protein
MRFYYQNLNDKPNKKQGSGILYGRFFWNLTDKTNGAEIDMEWSIARHGVHSFGFSVGCCESAWHISIHLFPIVNLYFTFRLGIPTPKYKSSITESNGDPVYLPDDREFEIELRDWAFHLKIWSRGMDWRSKDPWWIRGVSFHFDDFFLGKFVHSSELIEEKDILIPMPEGSYPAHIRMEYETWKRSRWLGKHIMRAHIDCPKGIPFEGKGENAWDCGEDATYGICCPAGNIEDAIGKLVTSVLRDRRKYGTPQRIREQIEGLSISQKGETLQ